VPITTQAASSNPAHGEVYLIQLYVIKFVSDFDLGYPVYSTPGIGDITWLGLPCLHSMVYYSTSDIGDITWLSYPIYSTSDIGDITWLRLPCLQYLWWSYGSWIYNYLYN
jgi:hypothetical protein